MRRQAPPHSRGELLPFERMNSFAQLRSSLQCVACFRGSAIEIFMRVTVFALVSRMEFRGRGVSTLSKEIKAMPIFTFNLDNFQITQTVRKGQCGGGAVAIQSAKEIQMPPLVRNIRGLRGPTLLVFFVVAFT